MRPPGAAFLLVLAAAPAFPQTRPLQTEEATPASGGRILLETGGDVIAEEPSYLTGVKRTPWAGETRERVEPLRLAVTKG